MPLVIAIDGPAAAGKGTLARAVADHYDLPFLDTGSLYRAAALRSIDHDIDPSEAALTLTPDDLQRPELRSAEIAQEASRISVIPAVRQALFDYQRNFATKASGAVLDGRDIGTVVAPDASVKFFITARTEIRAQRRHAEMQSAGSDITFEAVLSEMQIRDERDSTRSDAPLKPAEDAIIIDTSDLDLEAVAGIIITLIDDYIETQHT